MNDRIITYLKRKAISCEGKTIIVAVSGGPDSMALLHFFASYQKEKQIKLIAVTVNHQLRKEAAEDVAYVAEKCQAWQIPLEVRKVDVEAYIKKTDKSTQVAARELRYQVYAEIMEEYQADFLALGHHGDDQIETMLMSLMRTADAASFHGIPFQRPFARGEIIRPLLEQTKETIWDYCAKHKLRPRIDKSNEDERYTRNAIRKQIVPKLKAYNNRVHETVNHLQETLAIDEAYLQAETRKAWKQCVAKDKQAYIIKLENYYPIPRAIKRRLFRLLMSHIYVHKQVDLSYIHQEQWEQLTAASSNNQQIHFPQEVVLERSYDSVVIRQKEEKLAAFQGMIEDFSARLLLPTGQTLQLLEVKDSEEEKENTYIFSKKDLHLPLTVRRRQKGDRMSYRGLTGTKKIKDIFIDEKLPRHKRDEQLLVEDAQGKIIWLIGWKKGLTASKEEEKVCLRLSKNELEDIK